MRHVKNMSPHPLYQKLLRNRLPRNGEDEEEYQSQEVALSVVNDTLGNICHRHQMRHVKNMSPHPLYQKLLRNRLPRNGEDEEEYQSQEVALSVVNDTFVF